MHTVEGESLGQVWLNLLELTMRSGAPMGDEGSELLAVGVVFPAAVENDVIIERFGDRQIVAEMRKVFFADGPNALGHSYAALLRGPDGRQDLQDIIARLRDKPLTKQAVLAICAGPDGKVPCINTIQFLIRDGQLQTLYFARGQDVFRKFYADGLCIAAMARTVAGGLGLPAGSVTGWIGSSHVYHADRPAMRDILDRARVGIEAVSQSGCPAPL